MSARLGIAGTSPGRRAAALLLLGLAILLLTGCAGQQAYREGQALVASGRVEEGMVKFRDAATQDPAELQYRMAYMQARERSIAKAVEEAGRSAAAGDAAGARREYRHALTLDPANERALAGLRALEAPKPARTGADNAAAPDAGGRTGAALSAAYRKPISLEFKDVMLKQVFEVISRTSGLNFIFDKDVRLDQKVTLFLKNSSVEAAIYYTLLTNQLEQQIVNSNTVLVYPNAVAKQKDYQEMTVRTFHLTNADAKAVATTLKTIVKTRDIVVDEKLNMLIVRDNPDAIRLAARLVALHDVPEPEVMLEVEILEIKRDRILELGIAWPDSLSLTPLPLAAAGAASSASGSSGLTLRDLRGLNSSRLGAGIGSATINARQQDSDAKLLANPRIRARNHEKAKILIGDRVPLITTTSTATGFASESINYLDVGLKLDIEPSIHLDNDVAIKISLEVSNIVNQLQTKSGSVAYQIGTRTASTVLRLKDGENQVLAGLINDEDRRSARKIPFVGDLPVLGRLFGSTADDHLKTEIVLSITPHLIRNIERPDNALLEFRSGTENSLRQRPDANAVVAGTAPVVALQGTPGGQPAPAASAPGAPAAPAAPAPAASAAPATAPPVVLPLQANGTAGGGGAADAVTIRLQGPPQIKVGETFTMQMAVDSGQPLASLPLVLTYDPKIMEPAGVAEGPFLKQGGAPTSFNSRIDAGRILVTGTRTDDKGATAGGNFLSINFTALAPTPASVIQISNLAPVGLAGAALQAAPARPLTIEVTP